MNHKKHKMMMKRERMEDKMEDMMEYGKKKKIKKAKSKKRK